MQHQDKKEPGIVVPTHVGLIIDGNRRWARERNLSSFEGHLRGYQVMKKAIDWLFLRGVKIISVFVFSTENWRRDQEEVNYLMKLIHQAVKEETEEAKKRGYRILVSGFINGLPGDLPQLVGEAVSQTKEGRNGTVHLCINYGGRAEILRAVKKAKQSEISAEEITEDIFRKFLFNGGLPDPDIIVRTSGEQRLSGFLLWQSAYSEFLFLKKYWPDFEEADVERIIKEYSLRQRRFGK